MYRRSPSTPLAFARKSKRQLIRQRNSCAHFAGEHHTLAPTVQLAEHPATFLARVAISENVCRNKERVNGKHTQKPSASSIELHAVAGEHPNAKLVEILVDGRPLSFKVDFQGTTEVSACTQYVFPASRRSFKTPRAS
ncbi:hypothetical protein MTO96_038710 [Rhipicephalus appendiculatus]